jgi:hypothetical protein
MTSANDMRRDRLEFDYEVVTAMDEASSLIDVQAFASQRDLQKRCRQIHHISQGGSAGYYLVRYHVTSPVGPGKYHTEFDVVFDLMSKQSYPEEKADNTINAGGIVATCVSHPIPWSPHFLSNSGLICLGSVWQGVDHTLLAHVIVHVARLLNWDESMADVYGGWNPAAVMWWRTNLNSQPITPGLCYPVVPVEITNNVSNAAFSGGGSRRGTSSSRGGFQIINETSSSSVASVFKKRPNRIIKI